jgi:phosphotransferase system HPr (HPr) family protein
MAAFAEATKRFHCRVTLTYLDRHIEDATELMNLFPLVAPLGAEVLLEVEGADADAALPVLAGILGALDALPEPAPPVGPSS